MRTAITLVRLHGEENFGVVSGPDVPIETQIGEAKAFARQGSGKHERYAEIQVWTSSAGLTKRFQFDPPSAEPKVNPNPAAPTSDVQAPAAPAKKGRKPKKS